MTRGRRRASMAAAVAAFAVAALFAPAAARADTAYRYWTYYVAAPGENSWQYSQRGPATEHPLDGEMQGWRFAVQVGTGAGSTPRSKPDFGAVCGETAARDGYLRVGVVVDFGTAADAPAGESPPAAVAASCVLVKAGSTGFDVLQAAAGAGQVRVGTAGSTAGLVCGIDGYPRTECAAAVAVEAAPAPGPASTSPASTSPASTSPASTSPAPTSQSRTRAPSRPPAGSSAASSTAPGSSAASSTAPGVTRTLLASVRLSPSRSAFPTGALVGGVVALLLAAAAVRGTRARRRR